VIALSMLLILAASGMAAQTCYFLGMQTSDSIICSVSGVVHTVATKLAQAINPIVPFGVTSPGVDFNISTTTDFDAGTKTNTTTETDRYNQSTGNIELDFPYAKKGANLVSYWRFENNTDEETGTHNGIVNGPVYTSSGKFGGAYDFDGVNDYIDVGNWTPTQNITVSAWAEFEDTAKSDIVSRWMFSNTSNQSFLLTRIVSTDIQAYVRNTAGTSAHAVYTITPTPGTWYHLVGTYDGSNV